MDKNYIVLINPVVHAHYTKVSTAFGIFTPRLTETFTCINSYYLLTYYLNIYQTNLILTHSNFPNIKHALLNGSTKIGRNQTDKLLQSLYA